MNVQLVIHNKKILNAIKGLKTEEVKVIAQAAVLKYAKYLKENPQIMDPILDVNKLEFNLIEGKEDGSDCIDINELEDALSKLNKFEDCDDRRRVVRFTFNNEKVKHILEICRPRNGELITTALLYYIHAIEIETGR